MRSIGEEPVLNNWLNSVSLTLKLLLAISLFLHQKLIPTLNTHIRGAQMIKVTKLEEKSQQTDTKSVK